MATTETKAAKTVTGPECPACSGKRHHPHPKHAQVFTCARCGALHGTCYKGDSYALVLPYWHEGEENPEDTRYFDLEVLGSAGVERRHGWYHTKTKRITQTG